MYLNAAAVPASAETWDRARVCVGFLFLLQLVWLVFNNLTEIIFRCVDLKLAELFAGVTG